MTAPVPRLVTVRSDLDLAVREAGEGGPVLVLHGAPGPAGITPLVDHLATGHRVLAPTHPGWDDTARPDALDSVAALAVAYLDLLDQRELDGVTVVGTSFGGWVAARMAVDDHAGRISRLVLMNAIGPEIPGHRVNLPSGPPPGIRTPAARGGPPARMPTTLRAYTGPDLHDPGLLALLSAVTCPVLVIWGADDTVVTPDFGRAYAAAFPSGRFQLIPGAGHLPIREEPGAVFTALDRFLTEPAEPAA
ncbi:MULTISPECIES: alpha/beta fold hydrolase [Streptomyces]|uniref:Alpha/beta fold hydrolase n=1 Tax=Streptomyces lienomycini TaxID=284035 RepID=A0ABV9WX39_9ACTN|nr:MULTISPECIES: alpha/beta hydrolase [Streptomyces]